MADILSSLFQASAETAGVTVRVAVAFLADQSSPVAGRWFWSYHVRIENHRGAAVRLLARHWIIRDAHGDVHDVRGEGVVGEMPRIEPGQSFDYVSGCPLGTSSGQMAGEFHMANDDFSTFEIQIPAFDLLVPV